MTFRVVPDTNVVVAARRSQSAESPNREFIRRFTAGEFTGLFSLDCLTEYAEKLLGFGVPPAEIKGFLADMVALGEKVEIEWFHLKHYPEDSDDVCFLLCAVIGAASHLISYDQHLLDLDHRYDFTICQPVEFLYQLRAAQSQ